MTMTHPRNLIATLVVAVAAFHSPPAFADGKNEIRAVTFEDDGTVRRGTGGLVTALTGLASHRRAVWVASAMTEADARKAEQEGSRPFKVRSPMGAELQELPEFSSYFDKARREATSSSKP